MTDITRRPYARVYMGGVLVPEVASVQCAFGLTRSYSEASLVTSEALSWEAEWLPVRIELGTAFPLTPWFAGYYISPEMELAPKSRTLHFAGPLIRADRYSCEIPEGMDLTNAGAGKSRKNMILQLLDLCGLDAGELARIGSGVTILERPEDVGRLLGAVSYGVDDDDVLIGPFTLRYGESALSCIQRLDTVCGYRTVEVPGGGILSYTVSIAASRHVVGVFTEGVDLFSAHATTELLQIENLISCSGWTDEDGLTRYDEKRQASPFLIKRDGTPVYVAAKLSGPPWDMVERAGIESAGTGISAEEVCLRELAERNRKLVRNRWTTWRGERIYPHQTVEMVVTGRLGYTRNELIQDVEVSLDGSGLIQTVTSLGGQSSTAGVDRGPIADFSLILEREEVIGVTGQEWLYIVHCQSASVGLSGEILGWSWTATGGTPASGTGATFTTSYSGDVAGKSISLEVEDEHGLRAPVTKALPPVTDLIWATRKLIAAATVVMEACDPSWRSYTPTFGDVTVAGMGLFANADDLLLKSLDSLRTDASEIAVADGVDITALWYEQDASGARVALGLGDGRIGLSVTTGASWALLAGPTANPVLRIIVDRFDFQHVYLLDTSGLYESLDGGNSWSQILGAEAGETFEDVCISHSRTLVAMTGGRLLCDREGAAQLLCDADGLPLDPQPAGIIAVTADIREDRFYCYDSAGATWYHPFSGDTSLNQMTALPAGTTAQARGMWRDGDLRGLLYIAAGAKLLKSLDFTTYWTLREAGVGTSPAGAVYTQVGCEGLLYPIPIAAITVVSNSTSKVLSLWNGTGNDAPPEGWTEGAFDDATWDAATEGADAGLGDSALYIWDAAAASGEELLIRRTVALADGVLSGGVLDLAGSSVTLVAAYVNGVWLGDTITTSIPVNALNLVAGADNVIALHVRAS